LPVDSGGRGAYSWHHATFAGQGLPPGVELDDTAGLLDLMDAGDATGRPATPIDAALSSVEAIRTRPSAGPVVPGSRHWEIFARLRREAGARGNLVPDAWLAALAIEQGCEFVTTDRDYARFPTLRWRHPPA